LPLKWKQHLQTKTFLFTFKNECLLTLFTASTTPVNTDDLNECTSNFDSNNAYKNKVSVLSVPRFFKRSTNDAPFCGKPLSSGRTINSGSSYCTNILGFDGDGNGI
jgi:hypothetical protein